ncbi:MAG: lysophospholipase [Bacteroidales bacterium]|nr:lysophospholipase [Bacteroidales bacterium]
MTKKLFFTLMLLSLVFRTTGQDFTGDWYGRFKSPISVFTMGIHISEQDSIYTATMTSIDQNDKAIPCDTVMIDHDKITLTIHKLNITYTGILDTNHRIKGIFSQHGGNFTLNLTREKLEKFARPQDPIKPYTYQEEEVVFKNNIDDIQLAGTLTMPLQGTSFPAVVLISGSGAQNRDEEMLSHRPFLVLADHLTRNGIAVLRFDDRGIAASEGDFATAITTDFAKDVEAAIQYLLTRKEINPNQIGLIGHSEGGTIAPIVAARNPQVAFIVLLAAPGYSGYTTVLDQVLALNQGNSKIKEIKKQQIEFLDIINNSIIKTSDDHQKLEQDLIRYFKKIGKSDPEIKATLPTVLAPWYSFYIKFDPTSTLKQVKCPVLVLNGSKDKQVISPKNLLAVEKKIKKGGNKQVTAIELPGLNHLFQECSLGYHTEYFHINQTFSPIALEEISKWIINQGK